MNATNYIKTPFLLFYSQLSERFLHNYYINWDIIVAKKSEKNTGRHPVLYCNGKFKMPNYISVYVNS